MQFVCDEFMKTKYTQNCNHFWRQKQWLYLQLWRLMTKLDRNVILARLVHLKDENFRKRIQIPFLCDQKNLFRRLSKRVITCHFPKLIKPSAKSVGPAIIPQITALFTMKIVRSYCLTSCGLFVGQGIIVKIPTGPTGTHQVLKGNLHLIFVDRSLRYIKHLC